MALVTTPGASDADSYATIAEADAYCTARGIVAWTGADAAKEIALRRGTAYLENAYRGRWIGQRSAQAQALAWPRLAGSDADGFPIPTDSVPRQVQHAAIEAALLALQGVTLEPVLERGGAIKSKTERIGPMSESTEWFDGAPARDRYTAIDGLLRGLVTGSPGATSGNVRLVRA